MRNEEQSVPYSHRTKYQQHIGPYSSVHRKYNHPSFFRPSHYFTDLSSCIPDPKLVLSVSTSVTVQQTIYIPSSAYSMHSNYLFLHLLHLAYLSFILTPPPPVSLWSHLSRLRSSVSSCAKAPYCANLYSSLHEPSHE